LLTLFLAFAPVSSTVAETGEISPQITVPLMSWVAANMGINVGYMPNVVASRELMMSKIGNPMRQSALARALYVPDLVVIDDAFWNAADLRVQSFLVHELVHHAQYVSGRLYVCQRAKEWEAYHLQNLWLAQHGLPPAVDERWIARMALCE
jgi:hypothetical protein